jgi:nitrogen fixation-related uncharacterized protein
MNEAAIGLIITSAGIFAVFAGLFIWGLASGQFRNVEEPKYNIFEAEDVQEAKKGEDCNA